MLERFITLLVVLAVAGGRWQVGASCEFPKQFEGYMATDRVNFFPNDDIKELRTPSFTRVHARFSYDGVQQRSFQRETFTVNGKTQSTLTLTLAKQNVTYTIQDGKCTKQASGEWVPLRVPRGATLTDCYYMGSGRGRLLREFTDREDEGVLTQMTVGPGCVPALVKQITVFKHGLAASFDTFQNISVGLKHVEVFKVPGACRDAPWVHEDDDDEGDDDYSDYEDDDSAEYDYDDATDREAGTDGNDAKKEDTVLRFEPVV